MILPAWVQPGLDQPSVVAAIILAAGASTRLGRPKQLVSWGPETLLERAVRVAVEAGCTPVVVLGSFADQIASACDLSHCRVVINAAWEQGMGTSIRSGMEIALQTDADAVLVMTCDQPAVMADHLRLLLESGAGQRRVASAYAGRRGVPAYFPRSCFAALEALNSDLGARVLLRDAQAIDLPFGELDIDTEDQLLLAQGLLLRAT